MYTDVISVQRLYS